MNEYADIAIVTGGRDYTLTREDEQWLDQMWQRFGFRIVLHGNARGADQGAKKWAERMGLCAAGCDALWKRGPRAGHERNHVMAWACERLDAVCLAFPGGKGTASMRRYAQTYKIDVFQSPSCQKASS